ncbi:MAG TPA: ABC transporter ATP-binding protein [Pirellulales bacterium]
MNLIEAAGLVKSYGQGETAVQALRGVDLSVPRGQFLAITGPSGSGKSTCLYILGAVDAPTAGCVLLEGVDLATLSDAERTRLRRRRIGFVFQSFNLLPILSAVENVALPLLLDGVAPAEAHARANEMLGLVGLAQRAEHRPNQMSGGEQQRVAVARALVIRPALILADEPTGNLDSAAGAKVIDLLRALVDEHGQTVAMVTHDPTVARRADRIIGFRDGLIVSDQLCDEIAPLAEGTR